MGIADTAGRLFEAGFMLGVIRAVRTLPHPPEQLLAYYDEQRKSYRVAAVLDEFSKVGGADREALRTLGRFYLLKGHLAGYHSLQEYFTALSNLNGESNFKREATLNQLTLRYWQCTLLGDNRMEPFGTNQTESQWQEWLDPIAIRLDQTTEVDRATGGFLRADLLMLFRDELGGRDIILSLDTSSFGPGRAFTGSNLLMGSGLLHMLNRDVLYMANKGAFSRLSLETHTPLDNLFTEELQEFFTAFVSDDRETTKLIQAGSYAKGFADFARQHSIISQQDGIMYHIGGYSDRGLNTMTLTGQDEAILTACATIYSQGKNKFAEAQDAIGTARDMVSRRIQGSLLRLFPGATSFTTTLAEHLADTSHEEMLEAIGHQTNARQTYYGTAEALTEDDLKRLELLDASTDVEIADARWAHKELVKRALQDDSRLFVFLTGNPGIGKTTAISEFVKEYCHDEGYLLFYASPRKSVNRDIFEKFKRSTGEEEFYDPSFLGLETNSDIIKEAGGGRTVKYFGREQNIPIDKRGVEFLSEAQEREYRQKKHRGPLSNRLRPVASDAFADTNASGAQVLDSLSKAIGASLSKTDHSRIVAAVALQSLRRNAKGFTTLSQLFTNIFADAQNRENKPPYDKPKMEALAQRTRHLIFMVDEVTGDDSGYEFFQRIAQMIQDSRLQEFGFKIKIIVADASLSGKELVQQHLHLGQKEPDARKIYVARVPEEQVAITTAPVSGTTFSFADPANEDAWLVNSNTFPAGRLHIRYHVHVPTIVIPPDLPITKQRQYFATHHLDQEMDGQIVQDVCQFLKDHPDGTEQAIVYVQNKRRLAHIIAAITQRRQEEHLPFEREHHYMEIHADISEHQRTLIENEATRQHFFVFFITSSASRGLTFSKARYLFVDVPRFQIETNLMELVQVIYRGRGGKRENDRAEKFLNFYLSDQIVLTAEMTQADRLWRSREQTLDIMTMLALVKMCILTRISGAATIAQNHYSVIPIGGKSVAGGSRAYHHDLASLHKTLTSALHGTHANDPHLLVVHQALTALMERAEIRLPATESSYLGLYRTLSTERLEAWLLEKGKLPPAFTVGSLLIIPSNFGEVQTIHHMRLPEAISLATSEQTINALRHIIGRSKYYITGIRTHIKDFEYLVDELEQVQKSQKLEQAGLVRDSYYVLPMAMFVAKECIADYCAELQKEDDVLNGEALKGAMVQLVRDPFPIDTLLPIGWHYSQFPYLFITSSDLRALRTKTWKQGHLLMSPEMNILTMLLAKK